MAEKIEDIFEKLDDIIEKLEEDEGSLEDAFANYEQGMKLVKQCSSRIDKVEKQIQVLAEESGEGEKDEQ